ncbi:Methyltransferase domain-containing protein [Nocardioides terrae]|uniref:Methyltransferase domain-containing protein n=1 Tax=Nocardioides terrae TaxID=574651 RepID=A0A1I1EZD5_9ACTN|nr:methyltransferase domain-containing protein [Nocardioides terrae]SFB92371.1 Methyltransferase domain-containing protein [Nocardioides terrae]
MSLRPPHAHLRLEGWDRPADPEDHALLALCVGPTLDVGCGPGRLTEALAERGHVVLGIDVIRGAVGRTRGRGGAALRRDVFEPIPGEGRWETALLADGNIGIGGDPAALLTRLREVLDPRGRIVAEVAPPGTTHHDGSATLHWQAQQHVIRWSVVGIDAVEALAGRIGLAIVDRIHVGARWAVVLEGAVT